MRANISIVAQISVTETPVYAAATVPVTPHVHSTCTNYVLYAYLYCVYALVGEAISICCPYICAVHESVPMNRTLSSTGPLSVQ